MRWPPARRRPKRSQATRYPDDDDRAALGVAHLRRRLRPRQGVFDASQPDACRRATSSTCSRRRATRPSRSATALMDIKLLRGRRGRTRAVDPGPQGRVPAARGRRRAAFGALRPTPPLEGGPLHARRARDRARRPNAAMRAVNVHKRRERYTWANAWPSCTRVPVAPGHTRTIAVEAEDPAALVAAVRELGLGRAPRTSVPQGLEALARLRRPRATR